MKKVKNIKAGKINFFLLLTIFLIFFQVPHLFAEKIDSSLGGNFIEIKILDKVSSKNNTLKLKIGDEYKFKNLVIKSLKCRNSKFDDNPEITAYLQVKDLSYKNNNEVFVFNGWAFSSSPSLRPFDHTVYDIWLSKCY